VLTNQARTVLYVGVTNSLCDRPWQHRNGFGSKFAARYRVNRLVYVEEYADAMSAISREKQIKGGSRRRKIELIESINPEWKDLADHL
jgi:putative endonuclease